MASLDSTIRFIIKAEGEQAAVAALAKIEAAAQKAGTSVSKFMKTSAGESLANNLKLLASAANELATATEKAGKSATGAARAQDSLAASTRRSYFAQTALTTVLSAGINKAFLEMVDVTGQAIQRVDLIAQFPDAMAALGLSAKDASTSLATLSKYIGSIGGNLQEASTSVTRFAEITGNVKAATAEFVGINNALIAGAAPAQVQKNALEQLTQAYSRGVPQLIEWRSLLIAMPAQLSAVAKAMGFVNAGALGEALTNGKVSMQDFVTELTKLSTGTGDIAKQALVRMNGIQFAFNVFKNTLVEGVTAIIQTVGRQNIVNFFTILTGVVQQLAIWAVRLISILFGLFNIISKIFGGPQLKLANDNTAGIADNLASGADGAGDLADGLDDASKAAKKTANQLAAFDKMNVLSPPSDGSDGKKKDKNANGPSPLDAGTAAELEGIFDKIGGKVGEISTASKILAGILASIAGIKLAQGLFNQFNGLVKTIEDTKKNLGTLNDKFKEIGKSGQSAFGKISSGAGQLPIIFGKIPINPITIAIAAIAAVAAAIFILYKNNEDFRKGFDRAWDGILNIVKAVAAVLLTVLKPAFDALKTAFAELGKAIEPVLAFLGKLFQPLIDKIKDIAKELGISGSVMQVFGGIVGGVVGALLIPIGLVVGAITGIATAIIYVIAKVTEGVTWLVENFTKLVKILVDPFEKGVEAIQKFIREGVDKIGDAFNSAKKFIDDNAETIRNFAIVITTFLLPKIAQIAAEFAVAAYKSGLELAKITASAVAQGAKTSAVWVTTELPKIIKSFALLSIEAAKQAAKVTASFVASAASAALAYAQMVIKFVAGLAVMAAQLAIKAAQMAISWALALGPVGLLIAAVVGLAALIVANFDTIKEVALNVFNNIKEFAENAINWIKENWPLLLAIITGPIGLAVLAIYKNWESIKQAFSDALEFIKKVWNTVIAFFIGIWEAIKGAFSLTVQFFGQVFQLALDGVKAIWNSITGFFGGVWTGIKNVFATVANFFSDAFQGAYNTVTSIFSGLWNFFKTQVWDRIVSIFSSIGGSIGDAISGAFKGVINTALNFVSNFINTLINAINGAIGLINKIPGVNIGRIGAVSLPRLAKGGIVTQPTFAEIGESGKEAIVPLENNLEWIDKLADKINNTSGGSNGQPIYLTVQIGEDKVATKIIDLINEKTQMSGRNAIFV